jgi:poly(A) polymerase Pap1
MSRNSEQLTEELIETLFGQPLLETSKKQKKSKKVAKSWIKDTKTFKDKVEKAEKMGMENPAGFAAYMQHQATGKWPSED